MQRFTPRKPGSNWSKVNVEKVAKLREAGLMRPAGLAAFEKRSDEKDRRLLVRARRTLSSRRSTRSDCARIAAAAEYFFERKPPWYRRTATHWVVSAKREETRLRRLAQLIEDSAAGLDIKQLRR